MPAASEGIVIPMDVSDHAVTAAVAVPTCTRLVPWVTPKLEPIKVTGVPTGPVVTDRLESVTVWADTTLPAAKAVSRVKDPGEFPDPRIPAREPDDTRDGELSITCVIVLPR